MIEISYHLLCDGCGTIFDASVSPHPGWMQREDAKGNGWTQPRRKGKRVDHCDQCTADPPTEAESDYYMSRTSRPFGDDHDRD